MIETSILVGSPQASATKLLSLGDLSCTAMTRASGPELGTDRGGGEKRQEARPRERSGRAPPARMVLRGMISGSPDAVMAAEMEDFWSLIHSL